MEDFSFPNSIQTGPSLTRLFNLINYYDFVTQVD